MNIFKNKMAHLAFKESESGRRRKSKNIFIGVSVVGETVTAGLIGLKRIKRNQIKKHSMSNAEL